jgi:hypothetical protein
VIVVPEIAGCCSDVPVVLEKTVVLALTVTGPKVDPASVVEIVVATVIVFDLRVLSHLVVRVADWY